MRKISCKEITSIVKKLSVQANYEIGSDILRKLQEEQKQEESATGKAILEQIIENDRIAAREQTAICQDTGMVVVFVELGQEVMVIDGDFYEAINEGVKQAYAEAYLRKSIVKEPLFDRKNTGDNTPAVISVDIVPGDKLKIDLMIKGFGSENMSALKMLTPADGEEGVLRFILDTVENAGPNPCPPIIVGVGLGGTFEKAALLAKKALLRKVGLHNNDSRYEKLERELLKSINNLGIGPAGLGGRVTALAVNIEYYPTHIASIPVAVNLCCHASRHANAII